MWCACSLVILSAHPCTPAFPHACVDVASHVRYRVRLVMIRPGFAPGARRAFRVDSPCVKPFRIKQVAALHPVCVPCFACLSRVRQHQRGLRTRSAVQKSTSAFRIGSELELHRRSFASKIIWQETSQARPNKGRTAQGLAGPTVRSQDLAA